MSYTGFDYFCIDKSICCDIMKKSGGNDTIRRHPFFALTRMNRGQRVYFTDTLS
jgi:hypothetical protein